MRALIRVASHARMDSDYCDRKAEECELRAAEQLAPERRREWLRMASEWRLSRARPDEPPEADAA